MITPRFKLDQNDSSVTLLIRAPYSKLSEAELSIDECDILFLSSPYYLRLTLPGALSEENVKTSYDTDLGQFTFIIEKANSGEYFKDLQFITKLLSPKIDVLSPDGDCEKIEVLTNEGEPQNYEEQPDDSVVQEDFGFALLGRKDFKFVAVEFKDVFEVDPRQVPLNERRKMRLQIESQDFNEDAYFSDSKDCEKIEDLLKETAPWDTELEPVKFNNNELDFLKDLKNVDFKLNETQRNYCYCGLIDILYAYCYEKRTSGFETNPESGWTIVKLASTFSWLEALSDVKEALISAQRRTLIYPYFRSYDYIQSVMLDLNKVLALGELYLIKILIEMYYIFLEGDCCRYILNDLFIKKYIVFIMKWDKSEWNQIVNKVKDPLLIKKSDLGLDLERIENYECITNNLNHIEIESDDSDDDSCSSSSSSEDSSELDSDL